MSVDRHRSNRKVIGREQSSDTLRDYPLPDVISCSLHATVVCNVDVFLTFTLFLFIALSLLNTDVATSTFFNTDQSKIEYRKQVLLRFTTIGGDSMNSGMSAPDKLPPNLYVIVNNRVVSLPQPKPTAKPNSDVIRPGMYPTELS